MMAPSVSDRPSARELVTLLSSRVMDALHRSRRRERALEEAVERERQQRRMARALFARKRLEMQRMLAAFGIGEPDRWDGAGYAQGRPSEGAGKGGDGREGEERGDGGEGSGQGAPREGSFGGAVAEGERGGGGRAVSEAGGDLRATWRSGKTDLGGAEAGGSGGGMGRSGRVRVAGRTIAIASDRLRPIEDPMAAALAALHKLEFVAMLPPGPKRDWRRGCLERFRRHLFSAGQHAVSIKSHLVRLASGSQEVVDLDFGWEAASRGRGERDPGVQVRKGEGEWG